ncbi:MAG: uracil-DNA glycosylase [Acidimicrobiia bacterium]|nr:uracil-DNA glycosylase [Acidimicrobiia bacterium]
MKDFATVGTLDELEIIASGCTDCALHEGRTNVVFASGDTRATVMVVGEGPGQHEDEQGVPFVGRSGQLLVSLLAEQGIDREDTYIANVVKCRPPGNRDPKPEEIDACKPYLRRQIQLVDPTVVVSVGNFSTKLLMNTTVGITRLRGQAYEWWGRHLVPTFHPAAALRGGQRVADDMRTDIALVRAILDGRIGVDPPEGGEERPHGRDPAPEESAPHVPDPDQLDLFGSA